MYGRNNFNKKTNKNMNREATVMELGDDILQSRRAEYVLRLRDHFMDRSTDDRKLIELRK